MPLGDRHCTWSSPSRVRVSKHVSAPVAARDVANMCSMLARTTDNTAERVLDRGLVVQRSAVSASELSRRMESPDGQRAIMLARCAKSGGNAPTSLAIDS